MEPNKHLYKYVAPDFFDYIFPNNNSAIIKCSLPKEFNDPYELFLTINYDSEPELLAFYKEAIGDIVQQPTTCFSRSPEIPPMWAHYAKNLEGFVIEFDEEKLTEKFPENGFGDIDYVDGPDPDLSDLLHRAYHLQKPRYMAWLQQGVFSTAYYTKAKYWEYEQERRMIVSEDYIRSEKNLKLLDVPIECVKTIISGPRSDKKLKDKISNICNDMNLRQLEMKIGRSSTKPYFVDKNNNTYNHTGKKIEEQKYKCYKCNEPTNENKNKCSWCKINEYHIKEAIERNPFRILAHYGILEDYLGRVRDIESRKKSSQKCMQSSLINQNIHLSLSYTQMTASQANAAKQH